MRVAMNGAEVFVGNGGRTAASDEGPWSGGDTPTMVLLHGAGMDRTVWVLLARYFARHGVDVVVPDLPAHGASGGDPLDSIEAMAEWCADLLATLRARHGLGHGPLILVGHSMGSLLALELGARLARHRPSDTGSSDGAGCDSGVSPAAIWLLGSAYPMGVAQPLLAAARLNSPVAADIIVTYGHAYASRLGHNDVPGISVHNLARALLLRAAPGVLHHDLRACSDYAGGEQAADALADCPVHLIVGDEDRMTPARGARALAELTHGHLHHIENCGHMMMNEQPERVLATMRSLLAPLR